ncbi:MAG: ornithine carbamoyltransferase [Nitrososphaerota archaeon]
MVRHFLSLDEYTPREVRAVLDRARKLKKRGYPNTLPLRRKIIALIFQKPSTRTRVSIQSAVAKLGGESIYLGVSELQLGRGETVLDTGRVLGRYVDALVARVFKHEDLIELSKNGKVPVINALSDKHHPLQALADMMTIMENSRNLRGVKVAYVGDGNNVCVSLTQVCALMGVNISLAIPREYRPAPELLRSAFEWAEKNGTRVEILEEPQEAVAGADFVYTDVFVSMGSEEERDRRLSIFLPKYQVNSALLAKAGKGAKFMHCMPMHLGEEVTSEVAYGPSSLIYDQAENRMHTFAGLVLKLLTV